MTDETRDSEAGCPGQELTTATSQNAPPLSTAPRFGSAGATAQYAVENLRIR